MAPSSEQLREKRRAHRLAWRLIRFIETNFQWRIRFMPLHDVRTRKSIGFTAEEEIVGATLHGRQLICLDHAYLDLFGVLIHECLHVMLTEASEEEVLRLEELVRKHLTARQARAFIFLLNVRLM